MRDFVDDRIKDGWQSLLWLYSSGTPGRLQTCPNWTTDGTRLESAFVDLFGGALRSSAGRGRC